MKERSVFSRIDKQMLNKTKLPGYVNNYLPTCLLTSDITMCRYGRCYDITKCRVGKSDIV